MAAEEMARCPWCCEAIGAAVAVCPHCRETLDGKRVKPRKAESAQAFSEEELRYANRLSQSFVFAILVTFLGLLTGLLSGPALLLVARQYTRKALQNNFRTRPE